MLYFFLFYLVFVNGLLEELESSGYGACVCSVKAGNPTLADDITLIASSPANLQTMLDIVDAFAKKKKKKKKKWRLLFSAGKCSVLYYSSKTRSTCKFSLFEAIAV